MEIFNHHIYEYQKGLRRLVLCTLSKEKEDLARKKLKQMKICYLVWPLGQDRVNFFFGEEKCIEVLRRFEKTHLGLLSPEEDFILGTMLGYDRLQQCVRFLQRKPALQGSGISL